MFSSSLRRYHLLRNSDSAAREPATSAGRTGGPSDGSDHAAVPTVATSAKKPLIPPSNAAPSPSAAPTASPPVLAGDYHVLRGTVRRQRDVVRRARSDLASTLSRLGEHHVRQREYDEAMDAFVESLHEKRSAFIEGCEAAASAAQEQTVMTASTTAESSLISGTAASSLLSGMSESSTQSPSHGPRVALHVGLEPEERARELDDIISTLSNIGNVHSLRGEHAEAMQYYTEVTSIRAASRSSGNAIDASTVRSSGSSLSGGQGSGALWKDEDNSTIFSDINEDVKALDELFQSISFRNANGSGGGGERHQQPGAAANASSPRSSSGLKRRHDHGDTELPPVHDGRRTRPREEHQSSQQQHEHRHSSSSSSSTLVSQDAQLAVDQLSRAITEYRSALDYYAGRTSEEHEQEYMDFIDKITSLRARKQEEEGDRGDNQSDAGQSLFEQKLRLALCIYDRVLSAHRESVPEPADDQSPEEEQRRLFISCAVASTHIAMGSIHYRLGHEDEELRMYEEALTVYTDALGPHHPYVAGTCKNIGMVLAERCEFDAAMERFQQAKGIYSQVAEQGGGSGVDLASALSCMGNVQNRRGELDDALDLYGEALHIYRTIAEEEEEKEGGGGGPSTSAFRNVVSTLKIIGMVHAKRGHLDKAMECFQEAMDLIRTSGNGCGVDAASVLMRIAGVHCKQGQYDEALSNYQEAYDLALADVGTVNHPDVAKTLHYIGCIHHKRGQYIEAVEYYRRAVDSYRASRGPDSPAAATTIICMGSIQFKNRDFDSALSHYSEALRLFKGAYGLYHPEVAPTLKSIGMIHAKKGEFDEAMEYFQEVLLVSSAKMGQVHPDVASAYRNIGNVHFKRGEYGTAERQYRQALLIYRKTRGEGHPDTQSTAKSIEHIRRKMREADEDSGVERRDSRETGSRGSSRSRSLSRSRSFRC